ncbi:hypothetical protein ACLOJK_018106 [Asimina triloba]
MINFCKSWLGFSDAAHLPRQSPRDGLGLLVAADFQKPPNVLTSPAVKPAEKPPDVADSSALPDGCDGLRCCTESLGFESSDEIGAGEKPTVELARSISWRERKKAAAARTKEPKFPPPLPSLNRNGQRSSYMRAVRKDGRILITEVRMAERQETLRACREDGRLRLDLIRPRKEAEKDEDEEDGEGKEEEKEETVRQRPFPLTRSDGFRRCHEMRSRQQLHFWSARCVATT